MSSTVPAAPTHNPFLRIAQDIRHEVAERGNFPPGAHGFSARRTHQLATDPLPVLLSMYEEYGPVFTVRTLHVPQVFALGPEANHYITVSHAANFRWRDGGFGELEPLLGDGLLTIDGAYHRRARKVMLPAFHRTQIAAAADVMVEEITAALDHWRPGMTFDLYTWARTLAMRIAMKALMGLDPDGDGVGARAAEEFEKALTFYGTDYHVRVMRGPGSPWAKMLRARAELDRIVYGEIRRRRRAGVGRDDILDMLLSATDDEGDPLNDREVRDQAITLLFAGHDTTTSTISFLFYELARHPHEVALLLEEQERVLGRRSRARRAGPGGRHAAAGDGAGRGAAAVPAGLDRPPAGGRGVRAGRRARARGRARELQLLGQPPAPRRVDRPRGVPAGAVHARGEGGAAQGRLRAVRRRLAHLHRHALRRDGDPGDRHDGAPAPPPGAGPGAHDDDPPDAHAEPAARNAGDRPRAVLTARCPTMID